MSLIRINIYTVVVTVVLSTAAAFLFNLHIVLSLVLGAVLGAINFSFLFLLTGMLIKGRNWVLAILLWSGKFIFIILSFGLCLIFLKLDAIPLIIGATLSVLSVLFEGWKSMGAKNG